MVNRASGLHKSKDPSRLDLLTPFIVLLFFAMATCVTAVALLTSRANINSEDTAHAVVKGALEREMEQLRDGMVGTARWDDAVAHLYGTLDKEWALTNLTYPNDSFLVDERGRTLWATTKMGKRLDRQLDRMIPSDLRTLLARLPKTQKDAEARSTGEVVLTRYQGGPAVVAAMALAPLHRPRTIPHDDILYIIFVQPLDGPVLAKWQQAFQMQDIRWNGAASVDAEGYLPVRDSTGHLLGNITWQSPKAGRTALRDVLPMLLLIATGFVLASIWLFTIIRRSRQQISASMVEVEKSLEAAIASAAEAERALELAEDARRQAQAAQNDAMSAAQRETAERHQHAIELREANRRVAAELKISLSGMVAETLDSAAALERSASVTLAMVSDQLGQAAAIRDRSRDASHAAGEINATLGKLALSVGELKKASSSTETLAQEAHARALSAKRVNDNLLHNVDLVGRSAELIARISSQTNLLALNASIEAARSGEAGLGFAVVATEVKDLARLTHETTQAIQSRITGISNAATETVQNVETVAALVSTLLGSAVDAVATVQEQRSAVDTIEVGSRHVVENALASDDAIAAISASLNEIARVAADTRQIGESVRERAERLNGCFLTLMGQLEAA